jgi:parallel beta-helix repeat protein
MAATRGARTVGLVSVLALVACVGLLVRFVVLHPAALPRGAILVPRDAATLEEALRRVAPGGTIALDGRRGPFPGTVDVAVARVTICSTGATARIVGQEGASAIAVRAEDVMLRGLDVSGGTAGLLITGPRCRVNDVSIESAATGIRLDAARDTAIRDVRVSHCGVGIEVSSSSGTDIQRARLRDLSETGIRHTASWGTMVKQLDIAQAPTGVLIDSTSREVQLLAFRLTANSVAISIRDSESVTAADGRIRDAIVGFSLERTTGCEIRDAEIARVEEGIVLLQSLRNAVRGSTISASGRSGIRLEESADNSLTDNRIESDLLPAIAVHVSSSNLIGSNRIRSATTGVDVEESDSTFLLQNAIVAQGVGILVSSSDDCCLVRNSTAGGAFGIGVTSSARTIVRGNSARGQSSAALAVIGPVSGSTFQLNASTDSAVGLLAAASSDVDVLDNRISRNETGVLLFQSGSGVRLEANRIEDNAVGLVQTDRAGDLPANIDWIAAPAQGATPYASPVLLNNTFSHSRLLDIRNVTQFPVYAAGNRWGSRRVPGPAAANTAGSVLLEASEWKADVVIGTADSELDAVLGYVAAAALSLIDYHVVDLTRLGDSSAARLALRSSDIDAAAVRGDDATQDLVRFTLPVRAGWVAVVPHETADRLPQHTLSALASSLVGTGRLLLFTAPGPIDTASLDSLLAAYGLGEHVQGIVPARSVEEAESLLEHGACQIALLPALEEIATQDGYVALADDRLALPSETLSLVVQNAFVVSHPDVAAALAHIASRLTADAVHHLVQQERSAQRSPRDAALEYVTRENETPD